LSSLIKENNKKTRNLCEFSIILRINFTGKNFIELLYKSSQPPIPRCSTTDDFIFSGADHRRVRSTHLSGVSAVRIGA